MVTLTQDDIKDAFDGLGSHENIGATPNLNDIEKSIKKEIINGKNIDDFTFGRVETKVVQGLHLDEDTIPTLYYRIAFIDLKVTVTVEAKHFSDWYFYLNNLGELPNELATPDIQNKESNGGIEMKNTPSTNTDYRNQLVEEILYHKEQEFHNDMVYSDEELTDDYGTSSRSEAFSKFKDNLETLDLTEIEETYFPTFRYVKLGVDRLTYENMTTDEIEKMQSA